MLPSGGMGKWSVLPSGVRGQSLNQRPLADYFSLSFQTSLLQYLQVMYAGSNNIYRVVFGHRRSLGYTETTSLYVHLNINSVTLFSLNTSYVSIHCYSQFTVYSLVVSMLLSDPSTETPLSIRTRARAYRARRCCCRSTEAAAVAGLKLLCSRGQHRPLHPPASKAVDGPLVNR